MMDLSKIRKPRPLVFDPASDSAELLDELRRRHAERLRDGPVSVTSLLSANERDEAGRLSLTAVFWRSVLRATEAQRDRWCQRGGKAKKYRPGIQKAVDQLVAVWNDQRFGDPDILSIRSQDGGQNWSAPVRVNDDAGGAAQFFPWVDIDEDGVVHVVWYDRRENDFDRGYQQGHIAGQRRASSTARGRQLIGLAVILGAGLTLGYLLGQSF